MDSEVFVSVVLVILKVYWTNLVFIIISILRRSVSVKEQLANQKTLEAGHELQTFVLVFLQDCITYQKLV